MPIPSDDNLWAALQRANAKAIDHIATIRREPLPLPTMWRYDATTQTLVLNTALFEDDTVPLCQTDEQIQAAQRQLALERVLQEAATALARFDQP